MRFASLRRPLTVLRNLTAPLIAAGVAGCAAPTLDLPSPAALADLAPRSTLRVVFLRATPVQAVVDRASGELRGPAIDLARSLANRLGVPLETRTLANADEVVAGARAGTWDVAFLAVDPARSQELDFSRPYLEADAQRQALALPKGKAAGLAYVNQFVEQSRTSGFVERSIERSGLTGAKAAPAGLR